jgi:ribosomal protein L11 methylase PrmA
VGPRTVWDLGANTGRFARLAARRGATAVAFDVDDAAVERGFRETRKNGDALLHLVQDLTNPSASAGWANEERMSLAERGPADCVMALGLVHHLAIGNNVPLDDVVRFLARVGRSAVVEFVPKSDSQVKRLLQSREDIFDGYHDEGFQAAASRAFRIEAREPVPGSERVLYLLAKRDG